MSIISVVYVPEGIAMAADSRLTGYRKYEDGLTDRFTISDNTQKLFLLTKSKVGISWCGDAMINDCTIGDFIRDFEISQVEAGDSITVIAKKLQEYLIQINPLSGTSFYVAGYEKDEPFVYVVTRTILERKNADNTTLAYNFAFNGEYEAIDKLFNGPKPTILNFRMMPLKDAIDFAEFTIELVIKFQRFEDRVATCGGDIDILVITKDYARFVRHKILNPR